MRTLTFFLRMSRIEFNLSFDSIKLNNHQLLNELCVQLNDIKEQEINFHRILPNLSADKNTDVLQINVLFAHLIVGLNRGVESMNKNINFGFETQEEASAASHDVVRAKLLISHTYPQLLQNLGRLVPGN